MTSTPSVSVGDYRRIGLIGAVNAVVKEAEDAVTNIYQAALDEKFGTIMNIIAREIGYANGVNGLTAERCAVVEGLAEQSIINWAVERKDLNNPRVPITNLQHLLDEYCALTEHL